MKSLLQTGYWSIELLIICFAHEAIATFPTPSDGILYPVGDVSHKNKRGKKSPVAQKGRKNKPDPRLFRIQFVVLMATWDVYRVPIGLSIILHEEHRWLQLRVRCHDIQAKKSWSIFQLQNNLRIEIVLKNKIKHDMALTLKNCLKQ